MAQVQPGDLVQVHYKGTLTDGTLFDSSEGRDPLSFKAGSDELIPGFSQGVIGMDEGESKTLTIEAKDAYGDREEHLIGEVPRENLPDDVEVGSLLAPADNPDTRLVVTEVTPEHAVVDGNHPLAGQTLVFEVEIVSVTSAPG